jgi:general stress protein 26
MMIGLDGVEDGHARPMTAQLDGERGPIWFFTVKDHALVQNLRPGNRTIATFTSKGHDIFATVHGTLTLDNNRETICSALAYARFGQ